MTRVCALLLLGALAGGCKRPQPCDGETCMGHGTCRVVNVEESGPVGGAFERHTHLRRAEVCDCDGEDGFVYRPVGCGPAAEFSTCLPEPCSDYVERCRWDEVCVPGRVDQAPSCRTCPAGLRPTVDGLACAWPECLDEQPGCSAGQVCGEDRQCVACTAGHVPAEDRTHCVACPEGFVPRAGACEPLYGRGYLMTRMQVRQAGGDVVGQLNAQNLFRQIWGLVTADGYNMIWDRDLLLVFFFPEYPDGRAPAEDVDTTLYVYEADFGLTSVWTEARGEPEPDGYRNPHRTDGRDNYFPGELSGEECVRAADQDCNPAHFAGAGVMVEKNLTTADCSPTLARVKMRYGPDRIETLEPNWLLLPYTKYGLVFRAQELAIRLDRKPTGLCPEGADEAWPCTGYAGHVRAVVRAYELFSALQSVIRVYELTGVEDMLPMILGDPDVDLDRDGEADSHTLQFDVDLTPVVYAASLQAAGE